jgi:flagellar hook-associated protein 2
MSDLGVPGISSQYDEYIERLVDLAKVRRRPLENRLDQTKLRQGVWGDLNARLVRLQESGNRLYGLDNVFGTRLATSSNENVAITRPLRNIEPIDTKIQVHQIAAADRFSSAAIDESQLIEAGLYQFMVGDEEISFTFAGGNIQEFTTALNEVNPEVLRSSLVQSSARNKTWFLESKRIGEDHGIDFLGKAKELAFNLGIITDQTAISFTIENDTQSPRATGRSFGTNEELALSSGRMVALQVETEDDRIQAGAIFSVRYSAADRPRPSVSYVARNPRLNSEQMLNEGRLSVVPESNMQFDLPTNEGVENLFLRINDQLVPLPPLASDGATSEGLLEFALDDFVGQRIQGIVFSNQSDKQDITIVQTQLTMPSMQDWTAVNATSRAQNAEFTIDGVRVNRESNEIDDLLPGQTIELRSASNDPVQLSVVRDEDGVRDAIDEFLLTYNWTIAHINFATAAQGNQSVIDNTVYFLTEKEMENAGEILGLMQGDQQLNGLKSRLHMQMISAHPTGPTGDGSMSLGEMGISTRKLGSFGAAADRLGYFEIHDENRFREALLNRWQDVRDLFARDPVIGVFESGLIAGQNSGITAIAREYTITPRGLIQNRTTAIGSEITRQEKALTDFDEDLERKRAQWVRDFAAAENAQREMTRIQAQIDGMNRSQNR